jgi:hypothetical protein
MGGKRRIMLKIFVSTVASLDIMLIIAQKSIVERISALSLVTNVATKDIM